MTRTRLRRFGVEARVRAGIILYAAVLLSASAGSFAWRSQSHAQLGASFTEDLRIMGNLSEFRARVRRTEWLSEMYVLTGVDSLRDERAAALRDARLLAADLRGAATAEEERLPVRKLEAEFHALAADQEARIAERRLKGRGGYGGFASLRLAEKRVARIVNDLKSLHEFNVSQLEARRARARAASAATAVFMAVLVLVCTWLLAAFLRRELVGPVLALRKRILSFRPEEPAGKTEPAPAARDFALMERAVERLERRLRRQVSSLSEQAELRDRMVSMVSHEYGNAMTAFIGGLPMLEEGSGFPAASRQRMLRSMRGNAKALVRMTQDFLELASSGGRSQGVGWRDVSVPELLREAADSLDYHIQLNKAELVLDAPPDLPRVRANADLLSFVVFNLLRNAIKYTNEGGRIEMGARQVAGGVEVYVSDAGTGMDAETLARIRAGMARAPGTNSRIYGFGVGLSLVSHVLREHDSRLEVESEPGKGSRFWFVMPAVGA